MSKNETKAPAPWTAEAFGDDSHDIYDAMDNCIATVHGPGDGTGDGAVANLIAAAPDLLQFVIEYREEARRLGWGCSSLDAMATAVIDRVMGEATGGT
jgi:hypothetical protein